MYTLYHIHKPQKSNTGATWTRSILYQGHRSRCFSWSTWSGFL